MEQNNSSIVNSRIILVSKHSYASVQNIFSPGDSHFLVLVLFPLSCDFQCYKLKNRSNFVHNIHMYCFSYLFILDNTIKEFPITRLPPEKIVDTNGAGDAFVAGS